MTATQTSYSLRQSTTRLEVHTSSGVDCSSPCIVVGVQSLEGGVNEENMNGDNNSIYLTFRKQLREHDIAPDPLGPGLHIKTNNEYSFPHPYS